MNQNINNAQGNKWIAILQGMEGVMFKIVAIVIPSIVGGITEIGGIENVSLFVPGDHVVYDDLSIDFLVDEDYTNYQALFEWIIYNTKKADPKFRDLSVHFVDVNGNFRGLRLDFINAWPTVVTGFPMDVENADSDIQSNVTIRYERMVFTRSDIEKS